MQLDESRIRSFNHKIPREKIEAIWSIISFSSCCATLTSQSALNFTQPQLLLARLMFCDCGSLPNSDQQSPPSRLQVSTCRREIKWIDSLLSSRLLGDLPSMDSFLKQLIEKSVTLEAYDVVLSLLPSAPQAKVNTAVKQLWEYSCVDGPSAVIGSELQADLMDMNSIFLANETNNVYRLSPSSVLLQRCVSLAASYASMTMIKNTRWKSFRTTLQSLASGFVGKALEIENKVQSNAARIRTDDDYTAMFQSIIESATEIQIEVTPTSSHLREAACYLILSGVVARSRHNASGEGNNFHLNRTLRENVSLLILFYPPLKTIDLKFCSVCRYGDTPLTKRCASINSISSTHLFSIRWERHLLVQATSVFCILLLNRWRLQHCFIFTSVILTPTHIKLSSACAVTLSQSRLI